MLQTAETIRVAGPDDTQALCYILSKIAAETGRDTMIAHDDMAERVREDGPAGARRFDCLLAFYRARPSGVLIFRETYDAYRFQPTIQVDDLYVVEGARGQGLGIALLRAIALHAAKRSIDRCDWMVDRRNMDGINFYRSVLGGDFSHIGFRIEGEPLQLWARS